MPCTDTRLMDTQAARTRTDRGDHFSCSMSAVLLARVDAFGGSEAVDEVLRLAGSRHTREYLADTTNWIAYDEAVALWQAGARVTHHPQFARSVGEDAARTLGGSQVAAMLRSLGSPEAVYRQLATGASKFSIATKFETIDARPGYAELVSTAVEGFPRSPEHCAWTCGLLSCATELFGRPPAAVCHEECAAMGAEHCVYRVKWSPSLPVADDQVLADSAEQVNALRGQLDAMKEHVDSMFATAADLIAADDLDDVLARITRRAALEVRAIRYLLAVRLHPGGDLHCHHKGFEEEGVAEYVDRVFAADPALQPESWLVVPVRSNRRDYGRLLAISGARQGFLPQERELFEVYARYAASALDGASALLEAKERGDHASALLSLARALAAAGTSDEIARRLAGAVPLVVDCDRVVVYLLDAASGELARCAVTTREGPSGAEMEAKAWVPTPGGPLERLLTNPSDKFLLVDEHRGHPRLRELFATEGFVATVLVPLVGGESFLGLLSVSVFEGPTRLRLTADLRDRLSGVAAQATTALQNGRLLDEMTHQALHDQLTGLANRLQFTRLLRAAIERAREEVHPVTLLYMDLDGFKPVNDEFGHDVGDQLLVAVAKRLVACVREGDTVARLGGDEFAVLIDSETAPADAETVSDRLAAALTDPFVIEGHELRLGASIGRAVFPIDADDPDGLLRAADAAMFGVKRGTHPPHAPRAPGRSVADRASMELVPGF
ncbi:MAG TPA: diguanylate cyclase [Solirubrobacteraceae bacterium]|nr:diguanylate cyclase [Solirubrobacteraceae bacterium]